MSGIVGPADWKEILQQKDPFTETDSDCSASDVLDMLAVSLRSVAKQHGIFCLALSGGISSSVLASLCRREGLSDLVHCVAIGLNSCRVIKHPDVAHAFEVADRFELSFLGKALPDTRETLCPHEDLFQAIASTEIKVVVCGDTADELLGGCLEHYHPRHSFDHEQGLWSIAVARRQAFEETWWKLEGFLETMDLVAHQYGVSVYLPYFMNHDVLRALPLSRRVSYKGRKLILREAARLAKVPDSVLERKKMLLSDVWEPHLYRGG